MSVQEEPSYLMFARANARGGAMTSPLIVQELLGRIDRDAAALKAAATAASHDLSKVQTEWGVKSSWGCNPSKDRETAETTVRNMRSAGHEASVVWRGVTEWHHTVTDELAMQPAEAKK